MELSTPHAVLSQAEPSTVPFSRLANWVRHLDREAAPLILSQNTPNPHEGETCIPFTLLHSADVRLEIFDLLGRKMAVVVRKALSSGEHRIQLNLRGLCLPAGEYPYQLQAISGSSVHTLSRIMTLTIAAIE